jgi:hypothetical protein
VPDRGREMIALMSSPRGWGPSHQTQGQEKLVTGVLDAAGLVGFFLLLALPFAVGSRSCRRSSSLGSAGAFGVSGARKGSLPAPGRP